jgi:hypothetical protein
MASFGAKQKSLTPCSRHDYSRTIANLMLSRNHTLYHYSYCYFMFHYYCFACMDLDISVLLFYFSLVLCCLTELLFLYRSLTLIFYFIGVVFFFYSNGKYCVMFVILLILCYFSLLLSIRIWILFVLFLHIVILCVISIVYSNCHVCNISQVWANKTSLTPVKVNGRVFVLGVSICLFLRFFQCDILFLSFMFSPVWHLFCFVLSDYGFPTVHSHQS